MSVEPTSVDAAMTPRSVTDAQDRHIRCFFMYRSNQNATNLAAGGAAILTA